MKRLALLALTSTFLLNAGCGQRSTVAPMAQPFYSQPQIIDLTPDLPNANAPATLPAEPVVVQTPLNRLEEDFRTVALYGPVIEHLETLGANLDTPSGYELMASPESTQPKAIQHAQSWASDAEQLYLGWGFKWLSFIGHARHVFWSPSKKKLLTLDYGFWGNLTHETESENLAMTYGGSLIRQLLREPRSNPAFDGKAAFQRAKKAGFNAATNEAIKAILLDVYFLGPVWIFFDYRNQPAVIVDADDGRVISDSHVLEILKYLF